MRDSWLHRMTATLATALICGAVLPLATGCGTSPSSASGGSDGVQVVTSTNVYADIAATVGGTDVDVTSFISSPDQDPHSYEASNRNVLTVAQADVVIENGGGYDDFIDTLLDQAEGPTVLDAVDISGHAAPAGWELNEHVWYDLPSMQKVATKLAEALGEADPANAKTYTSNAKAFNDDLQTQIDRERELKQDLSGTGVGITEPVPVYLLESLGLVDKTPADFSQAVEEGEEVAVSVLDQTLRLYSEHQVAALVYNEQTTGPVTEQVKQAAEDAGVAVVSVTETLPSGESYVSWMTANLDHLDQALSDQ